MKTASITSAELSTRNYSVNQKWLLSLYAVIPICFLFAAVDTLFLGNQYRDVYLPNDPISLILFAIIFNFPHVLSSFITLADKEYLTFYKKRFSWGLGTIVFTTITTLTVLPLLVPSNIAMGLYGLFLTLYGVATMWHVLSQQYGIGMMLSKTAPQASFQRWRTLSTIAAAIMYFLVFTQPKDLTASFFGYPLWTILEISAGVFVILACYQGWLIIRKMPESVGKLYCLANLALLPATLAFLHLEYNMLVILIPRFVHDLTAFMIYSVHDQTRNQDYKHNYFYRWLSFIPIQPIFLCFIAAILLANSIECGAQVMDSWLGFQFSIADKCGIDSVFSSEANGLPTSMRISLQLIYITGLFHYYIESFVWKRDSIHRHSVKFS